MTPFDHPEAAEVRTLSTPAGSLARICRYGRQVLSWMPTGECEVRLFLSQRSDARPSASIRGGVPVIFPQFGKLGSLPKHGFSRTRAWQWQWQWQWQSIEGVAAH